MRELNPKRRKRTRQIRQRQLRRRKNLSFQQLSADEAGAVAEQEMEAKSVRKRLRLFGAIGHDRRTIEVCIHGIRFKSIIGKLRECFPNETLEILDEGAGRSNLKKWLMRRFKGLRVTTTDVCEGRWWPMPKHPDEIVNVLNLVKSFGKNRFHLVVSTVGGAWHSPVPEKAFFQIVSVLKPGGIGVVSAKISNERLKQLAKRFNLTIKQHYADSIVFSKNFGRAKKR